MYAAHWLQAGPVISGSLDGAIKIWCVFLGNLAASAYMHIVHSCCLFPSPLPGVLRLTMQSSVPR